MTKRRLIRWSLILAILAAFAVWLEPTRVVWGWLRGEAFYQGRPTCWWRQELSNWEIQKIIVVKTNDGSILMNSGGVVAKLPTNARIADGGPIQEVDREVVQYWLARVSHERILDWFAVKVLGFKRHDASKLWSAFLEADLEPVLGELQIDRDPDVRAKTDVIARYRRENKK